MLGKFSNYFKYFLRPFLFLLFFWDPYNLIVGEFNVVPEVSETVLSSFHYFFFILLCSSYFHSFILRSLICFSASVILLLIPSREYLISFILLFIIVCFLFSSSKSLLNVSSIYPILFPRFWIIFTLITLNSFSGRLPISSSLVCLVGFYLAPSSVAYFSVFSFCLTYCVWGLLFTGCRFIVCIVFGVYHQWIRFVQLLV